MAEKDPDPQGENIPADSVENEPGVEEFTQAGKERLGGDDELASLLEFDPFEEGNTAGSEGQGSAASGEEGSGTGEGDGTQGQPQGEPQGQPSAPSGQEDPAQLRQQLDEALRTIYHLRDGQGNQGVQPGAQPGQQGQMGAQGQDQGESQSDPIPNYQFQIPDQLIQMMDSDDPTQRKQAFSYMAQGVAQTVHQQVRQEYQQRLDSVRQELPQQVQQMQAAQEQQRQVFEDFYGTYQDLNRPELRPTIVNVAEAVATEFQQQGKPVQWGPEFKQAVANRTYQVLGRQPGGQPQQAQARKPSQPRNFGGNARRGVGQADTEQADIERTLFG